MKPAVRNEAPHCALHIDIAEACRVPKDDVNHLGRAQCPSFPAYKREDLVVNTF